MAGLCKAVLIGHLGRDPEVRHTPDGLAVANFSLACSEKVKGEDKTQWLKCTAFGKLAEICGQYLTKGKQVYCEGRLSSSEWTDQEDNKRFSMDVVLSMMHMLGTKGESEPKREAPKPKPEPDTTTTVLKPDDDEDSIPF